MVDNVRKIKVNESSGYKYKSVPQILLKGKYLNQFGFPIDTKVSVTLSQDQIIITPLDKE